MNTSQTAFVLSGGAPTQESRILDCLQANLGEWVGIPTLYAVSGSFVIHSRISSLRGKGCNILNKTERAGKQTLSFYKLLPPT